MAISVIGHAQQPASIGNQPIQSKTQTATPQAPETKPADITKKAETAPVVTPEKAGIISSGASTTPQEQTDEQPIDLTKPILIMVNESAPDQVMVFDTTGKWLDNVKIVNINLDVGTGMIVASLTSWKGVMRPKTPKVLKTKVKELKSVTAEIFNDKLEEQNK